MMVSQQTNKITHKKRNQLSTPLALSLGVVAGAGLLLGTYFIFLYKSTPNIIPPGIKKQVSFNVFYPSPDPTVTVDSKSFKYDSQAKLMSYVITYVKTPVTIAEQATPQNFIDIPQAYDKLIESLSEYGSFQSYYDKVSLTHPKEFNGQQSAVMNSKGTLVFAHPTRGDLTEDQWKKLFNGFEVIR